MMDNIKKLETAFPELAPLVKRVLVDFPDYEKNVFLMMRFEPSRQFMEISRSIREALQKYGLWGIRADDKAYSDDLWLNICAYMRACNYGVAVFEDIEDREMNPNIALEYGYMMALGKRTLLLKEERMPKMPTDITGRLWKPFSVFDIQGTIEQQIDNWAVDIGLSPIRSNERPYVPEVSFAPMAKEILLNQAMDVFYLTDPSNRDDVNRIHKSIEEVDTLTNPQLALKQLTTLYNQLRRYVKSVEKETHEFGGSLLRALD